MVEKEELYRYAQFTECDFVFYDRFILICKEHGVSPSRAAIDAGLSKSTVTKWNTSPDSKPTGAAIQKLTNYFNISIAELLGEESDIAPNTKGSHHDMLDEVDVAFYGDFKELNEDDKATVRDMVRIMRERRSKKQEK